MIIRKVVIAMSNARKSILSIIQQIQLNFGYLNVNNLVKNNKRIFLMLLLLLERILIRSLSLSRRFLLSSSHVTQLS